MYANPYNNEKVPLAVGRKLASVGSGGKKDKRPGVLVKPTGFWFGDDSVN
jgi:hypothetical protein